MEELGSGLVYPLLVLAALFIFTLFLNTNNLEKRFTEINTQLKKGLSIPQGKNPVIDTAIADKIDKNQKDINYLMHKISELEKGLYQAGRVGKHGGNELPLISPSLPDLQETLFFPNPEQGGFFVTEYATAEINPGASMYQLRKLNPNMAEVTVLENEAATQLLLASPRNNIEPVCNSLNNYNPNTKRITTLIPGKAELTDGGRWKMAQKIQIRYE
jgi:hypothetical protein